MTVNSNFQRYLDEMDAKQRQLARYSIRPLGHGDIAKLVLGGFAAGIAIPLSIAILVRL